MGQQFLTFHETTIGLPIGVIHFTPLLPDKQVIVRLNTTYVFIGYIRVVGFLQHLCVEVS